MDPAADLLARLHPLRPPAATAQGVAAEALAALALGLALAALVALALRLVAQAQPTRRGAARRKFERARALPPQARLAAQVAALREATPGGDWAALLRPAEATALRAALYGAAPADTAQTDRALRRAFARLGG